MKIDLYSMFEEGAVIGNPTAPQFSAPYNSNELQRQATAALVLAEEKGTRHAIAICK